MTPGFKRTVFISGASRGLGEKMAVFFLSQGWTVFSASRTKPKIKHKHFSWKKCDISKPAEIRRLFAGRGIKFDCVINSAATGGPIAPSLNIPMEKWKNVFDANFFSHLEVTRRIMRHCKPRAVFIFLSGRGSVTPRPLAGPYAISKLAVVKLAEQLACEYPSFRFYAIAPGAHDTRMARAHLRRLGEPVPEPTDFRLVERLIGRLLGDRKGRLNGRLIHVRDDIRRLLSLPDGGTIRRMERR